MGKKASNPPPPKDAVRPPPPPAPPRAKAMGEREQVNRLETALKVAATTLEQIATTPRNRGARLNASATLGFLKTQGLL